MIVAIEGPSAAGKTTWCRSHFPHNCLEAAPEKIAAPDLYAAPAEVGKFWVNYAVENWQRALAIEREHGIAVCDGDPFHLYYSWALWKSGALTKTLFEIESELYRSAFENKQVGFVDHVLWLDAPIDELRRRAKADTKRRRKRHETYLALMLWMKAWFQERERLLPGTLHPLTDGLLLEALSAGSTTQRYAAALMDGMVARLRKL
jgi:deoxyadenosine/deoxycytidine kinase